MKVVVMFSGTLTERRSMPLSCRCSVSSWLIWLFNRFTDILIVLVDALLQFCCFRAIEFHVSVDVGDGDRAFFLAHVVLGAVGDKFEQLFVDGQLVLNLFQLFLVEVEGILQFLDLGGLFTRCEVVL